MTDESMYFIESQEKIVDLKTNPAFLLLINGSLACKALFTKTELLTATSKDYALKLEKSSKAFTVAGIETRNTVAQQFSVTAAVVSSYGAKIGEPESTGIIRYTKSRLLRGTVNEQADDCNYILEIIQANAAALVDYNIDAAYINNLEDLVDQLLEVGKTPQEVIKQHAIDNKLYFAHEKTTRKFFEKEMDPFMEFYKLTNMEFYLSYLAARKVRHHHMKRKPVITDPEVTTGILETLTLFKDTLAPAPGVSLVVASLNISEISDEEGETYIDEIVPETYHGKLSLEGYTEIEFDFTIEAGRTCSLQFLMEVILPPVPPT